MPGLTLFILFFAGNDKLHPIQYYTEHPSKSSENKLISSLVSTDTNRVFHSSISRTLSESVDNNKDISFLSDDLEGGSG